MHALAKAKTMTAVKTKAAKARGRKEPARKTAAKAVAARPAARQAAKPGETPAKRSTPAKAAKVPRPEASAVTTKQNSPSTRGAASKNAPLPEPRAPLATLIAKATVVKVKHVATQKLVDPPTPARAPERHPAATPVAAAQPRADLPPTSGFTMLVDGHFKSEFDTLKHAKAAAAELLGRFPMLRLEIYDAAKKARVAV